MIGATFAHAQQGPVMTPQVNTDYYVGTVSGFYPSIQNAVTQRCAAGGLGSRVIIPAGSPADGTSGYTISAVTGGCVKVTLEDRRVAPVGDYKWITTAYVLQSSSVTPAGGPNDLQTNLNGTSLGADPGILTNDNLAHVFGLRNMQTSNAFLPIGMNGGQSVAAKNFDSGFDANGNGGNGFSVPWQYNYFQSVRPPFGGFAMPSQVNFDIQGGFENGTEFQMTDMNFTTHSPGQIGGMESLFGRQLGFGDYVQETKQNFAFGCSRGTDECFEHYRDSAGFINNNWGGTLALSAPNAAGDVPIMLTPFGGYQEGGAGEQAILYDLTRRHTLPDLAAMTPDSSGFFVKVTLPGHGYVVSNRTTTTADIDSRVYTGTCPSVTPVPGQTYPQTIPYINGNDGFTTPENGLGVPQRNSNFVNAPGGALVGYCVSVASTAGMTVGDKVGFYASELTPEFDTVRAVSDATHFTAYLHHQYPAGTVVAWDPAGTSAAQRSIGRALGFNADEVPAGTQDSELGRNPQLVTNRTVYPYGGCIDANTCLLWINNGVAGQELKTRGYTQNTYPGTPIGVTFTVAGGVVTAVDGNNNSPQMGGGGSPFAPVPNYIITGCTVAPVLKFTLQIFVNHGSWQPSLVSGGSGCTTPVINFTTFANPVYDVPMTWTVRVIDTARCHTFYPFSCLDDDGYALVNPWIINTVANGDEIAQGQWWQRYGGTDNGFKFDYGDDIVAFSQRGAVSASITGVKNIQSGKSYKYYFDLTPTSKQIGTFATNWQPDPAVPGSGAHGTNPFMHLGGHLDTIIYDLPPMTNSVDGIGPHSSQPGVPSIGGNIMEFRCDLPFTGVGVNLVDDPCKHGQFVAFNIFNLEYGPAQSQLSLDPFNGVLSYNREFDAFIFRSSNFPAVGQDHYIIDSNVGPSSTGDCMLWTFTDGSGANPYGRICGQRPFTNFGQIDIRVGTGATTPALTLFEDTSGIFHASVPGELDATNFQMGGGSNPIFTGTQGIGTKILSYTGTLAGGNLIGTDANGTAIDSGIAPSNVVRTNANNVFTGNNVFGTGNNTFSTQTIFSDARIVLISPAPASVAPTGACSVHGQVQFTADGHGTYCAAGGTWTVLF
jgi:hypothetical protein